MADDIDDLLDEVETKYVDRKKFAAGSSNRHRTRNKLDEDINDILSDTHTDDELSVKAPTTTAPVTTVRDGSIKSLSSSGQKCYPVYLGGSTHATGHGTAISQRACDRLRCTACDFKVCQFDNYKWHSDTNYLFLRNNVPDFAKLKSKLSPSKGQRAYCCQCSWRTIKDLIKLDDPQLKWHCGKH